MDPDFKTPAPLLDPASVRCVCGTVAFLGALVFSGFVCWTAPEVALVFLKGAGVFATVALFLLLMVLFR